jgi:hypothetical protein
MTSLGEVVQFMSPGINDSFCGIFPFKFQVLSILGHGEQSWHNIISGKWSRVYVRAWVLSHRHRLLVSVHVELRVWKIRVAEVACITVEYECGVRFLKFENVGELITFQWPFIWDFSYHKFCTRDYTSFHPYKMLSKYSDSWYVGLWIPWFVCTSFMSVIISN